MCRKYLLTLLLRVSHPWNEFLGGFKVLCVLELWLVLCLRRIYYIAGYIFVSILLTIRRIKVFVILYEDEVYIKLFLIFVFRYQTRNTNIFHFKFHNLAFMKRHFWLRQCYFQVGHLFTYYINPLYGEMSWLVT